MDLLNGYKTYLAAAGLFGLALYQFSQGQVEQAIQSFLGGLAAVGLRNALKNVA
ncbi:MAG: hypothetical protein ACO3F3_17885 [Gemmataceae bacterium]